MKVLLTVEAKLQLCVCVSPVCRLQGDAGFCWSAGSRDPAAKESELVPADALAGPRRLSLLCGPEVPRRSDGDGTHTHTFCHGCCCCRLVQWIPEIHRDLGWPNGTAADIPGQAWMASLGEAGRYAL